MISSETPYKLAEIIRDTWYNLYYPHHTLQKESDKTIHPDIKSTIRKTQV